MDDPGSLLHVYRRLLQVRRENPSLHRGSLVVFPQDPKNPDLLAYFRHLEGQAVLVLLNFGSREITFQDDSDWSQEILSTGEWSRDQAGHIQLAPYTSLLLIN
jgi:glycosidase